MELYNLAFGDGSSGRMTSRVKNDYLSKPLFKAERSGQEDYSDSDSFIAPDSRLS